MDIWYWIMWGTILIALTAGIGFWLIIRSYPYKVRIRKVTSTDVRLIHDTIGKISKDDEKISFLKLFTPLGELKRLPLPPPNAVDYDPKKKKQIIEAWHNEEQGLTYVQDKGQKEGFQPLTTKHRQMLVHQLVKRESRKIHKWQEHIPLIVGATALVMLVTVFLIFWGEAMAPIQEAANTAATASEKATELINAINAWERGAQIVQEAPP